MVFPLLQKPTEMCVDRQIKVLGSYWKGHMSNEETNSLYLCTVNHLSESLKFKDRERSVEQMETEELEDFIRLTRAVMQLELQECCFDKKLSNSHLVQVT
jgi:hypothetical protein